MFSRLLNLPLPLLPLAYPPDKQVSVPNCDGGALLAHAVHVRGPLLAWEVQFVPKDTCSPPAERLHGLRSF